MLLSFDGRNRTLKLDSYTNGGNIIDKEKSRNPTTEK